jgi:hypothetical protein
VIVFEKCDPKKRPLGQICKTEAEIEKWMAFKFIVTLENRKKFIQYKFKEERIEERS